MTSERPGMDVYSRDILCVHVELVKASGEFVCVVYTGQLARVLLLYIHP